MSHIMLGAARYPFMEACKKYNILQVIVIHYKNIYLSFGILLYCIEYSLLHPLVDLVIIFLDDKVGMLTYERRVL